jgi:single-strand DNA-binding protein
MANLNKVMLIGRLTRDPEERTFSSGGKVAKFGFAVSNRKKNSQTGKWEDEPVFLDVEAFNRGNFTQADFVMQYLRKGSQAFVEGHLRLDQWTSKDGVKLSKLVVVMDGVQFLDGRGEGASGGRRESERERRPAGGGSARRAPQDDYAGYEGGGGDDIPF